MLYRQGDTALIPSTNEAPKGTPGRVVLARGVSTGHEHVLVSAIADADPPRLVYVPETTTLDHPEHGEISIEPGVYAVRRQIESDNTQVED